MDNLLPSFVVYRSSGRDFRSSGQSDPEVRSCLTSNKRFGFAFSVDSPCCFARCSFFDTLLVLVCHPTGVDPQKTTPNSFLENTHSDHSASERSIRGADFEIHAGWGALWRAPNRRTGERLKQWAMCQTFQQGAKLNQIVDIFPHLV